MVVGAHDCFDILQGRNQAWHWDDPTDYFAHVQAVRTEGTWANTPWVENGGKSKIFIKKKEIINQYNHYNIGFKVLYHGMVMFYVNLNLNYHIFI